MMEISQDGNAWTVRIPGAKEGDVVEMQDVNGIGRHIRVGFLDKYGIFLKIAELHMIQQYSI